MDNSLFEALKKHIGHDVEISEYGDMQNVSLECFDCNEVILDAELYELAPVSQDENELSVLDKASLFDAIVNDMCEIDGISETIWFLRKLGLTDGQLKKMHFEM